MATGLSWSVFLKISFKCSALTLVSVNSLKQAGGVFFFSFFFLEGGWKWRCCVHGQVLSTCFKKEFKGWK